MKFVTKATVSLLALLLVVLPVMACVQPGVVMTAAERACCKQMAQHCGDAGMAKSHKCCHPQISHTDWHALQSSYHYGHPLVAFHTQPATGHQKIDLAGVATNRSQSSTDSPPLLLSSDTTVLRI